jgi:hypothetical protein
MLAPSPSWPARWPGLPSPPSPSLGLPAAHSAPCGPAALPSLSQARPQPSASMRAAHAPCALAHQRTPSRSRCLRARQHALVPAAALAQARSSRRGLGPTCQSAGLHFSPCTLLQPPHALLLARHSPTTPRNLTSAPTFSYPTSAHHLLFLLHFPLSPALDLDVPSSPLARAAARRLVPGMARGPRGGQPDSCPCVAAAREKPREPSFGEQDRRRLAQPSVTSSAPCAPAGRHPPCARDPIRRRRAAHPCRHPSRASSLLSPACLRSPRSLRPCGMPSASSPRPVRAVPPPSVARAWSRLLSPQGTCARKRLRSAPSASAV